MGLIKAAVNSIGSEFHDQWKDLIRCDDMSVDILMKKVTTSNGVISKDSKIIVAPGQIAVIYDSGNILDATAEEGIYEFDRSSSPSFFAGQFGNVFKDMWSRFTYGGAVNKEQAVFYINGKEIINNKFGTISPVLYQDYSHSIPNQMTNQLMPLSLKIKCFGNYVYKVINPAQFMRKYAGTADVLTKDELNIQLRSEVLMALQKILNSLSTNDKIPVLDLPSHSDDIKKTIDSEICDEQIRDRGIQIVHFVIESISLDDESQKKLDEYEHNSNPLMQQGRLLNVMEKAAENENGAITGVMGVGMIGSAFSNNSLNQNANLNSALCPKCGSSVINSNYCPTCGEKLR